MNECGSLARMWDFFPKEVIADVDSFIDQLKELVMPLEKPGLKAENPRSFLFQLARR